MSDPKRIGDRGGPIICGPTPGEVWAAGVAEQLGISMSEFGRLLQRARWGAKAMRAEMETAGWQERLKVAVAAGDELETRESLNNRIFNILAAGPQSFSALTVDALVELATEARLKASARQHDPLQHGGLLVLGPTGIGKSSTGAAIIRRMLERNEKANEGLEYYSSQRSNFTAEWVRCIDLPNARLERKFGEGESPLVERARESQFLVLDDLGWESKRAGADDVVMEVIQYRYDLGRPTYATSGLRIEQFTERYGDAVMRRLIEAGGRPGRVLNLWPKS